MSSVTATGIEALLRFERFELAATAATETGGPRLRGGLAARLGLPCWSVGSINVALLVSGAGGAAAFCTEQ